MISVRTDLAIEAKQAYKEENTISKKIGAKVFPLHGSGFKAITSSIIVLLSPVHLLPFHFPLLKNLEASS